MVHQAIYWGKGELSADRSSEDPNNVCHHRGSVRRRQQIQAICERNQIKRHCFYYWGKPF